MPVPVLLDWLPTTPDAASMATRAVVFVLIMVAAFVAAATFRGVVLRIHRRSGDATRRLLGRAPAPGPWATGEWACGRCYTVNRAASRACERCQTPRAEVEMVFDPVPTEPDTLPASIPAGSGATVTLEHNPGAHMQGLNGHWRLRVNSVIVGSAARRDGALALLRAVEGADAVLFDPSGEGYAAYSLAALIAAFEGRRLPLHAPCPERER